jgi:hypothetical protein
MVQREWTDYDAVKTTKQVYQLLKKRWKQLFRQLMSDVPYSIAFRRIRFLGYFGYSQNMPETYRVRRCC